MKLCYISYEYPLETNHGGIGTYTYHAARCMAQRGHEVHVITCTPEGAARVEDHEGVHVSLVPPGTHPLPGGRAAFPLRVVARWLMPQYLGYAAWVRSAASEFRCLHDKARFDVAIRRTR